MANTQPIDTLSLTNDSDVSSPSVREDNLKRRVKRRLDDEEDTQRRLPPQPIGWSEEETPRKEEETKTTRREDKEKREREPWVFRKNKEARHCRTNGANDSFLFSEQTPFSFCKDEQQHISLSGKQLGYFRTKLCVVHKAGNCSNADRCADSHCLTWQRRNPFEFTYEPKLCPDIQFVKAKDKKMTLIRRCNRGKKQAQLNKQAQNSKVESAKSFFSSSRCSVSLCTFKGRRALPPSPLQNAHGSNEIRSPNQHFDSSPASASPTLSEQDFPLLARNQSRKYNDCDGKDDMKSDNFRHNSTERIVDSARHTKNATHRGNTKNSYKNSNTGRQSDRNGGNSRYLENNTDRNYDRNRKRNSDSDRFCNRYRKHDNNSTTHSDMSSRKDIDTNGNGDSTRNSHSYGVRNWVKHRDNTGQDVRFIDRSTSIDEFMFSDMNHAQQNREYSQQNVSQSTSSFACSSPSVVTASSSASFSSFVAFLPSSFGSQVGGSTGDGSSTSLLPLEPISSLTPSFSPSPFIGFPPLVRSSALSFSCVRDSLNNNNNSFFSNLQPPVPLGNLNSVDEFCFKADSYMSTKKTSSSSQSPSSLAVGVSSSFSFSSSSSVISASFFCSSLSFSSLSLSPTSSSSPFSFNPYAKPPHSFDTFCFPLPPPPIPLSLVGPNCKQSNADFSACADQSCPQVNQDFGDLAAPPFSAADFSAPSLNSPVSNNNSCAKSLNFLTSSVLAPSNSSTSSSTAFNSYSSDVTSATIHPSDSSFCISAFSGTPPVFAPCTTDVPFTFPGTSAFPLFSSFSTEYVGTSLLDSLSSCSSAPSEVSPDPSVAPAAFSNSSSHRSKSDVSSSSFTLSPRIASLLLDILATPSSSTTSTFHFSESQGNLQLTLNLPVQLSSQCSSPQDSLPPNDTSLQPLPTDHKKAQPLISDESSFNTFQPPLPSSSPSLPPNPLLTYSFPQSHTDTLVEEDKTKEIESFPSSPSSRWEDVFSFMTENDYVVIPPSPISLPHLVLSTDEYWQEKQQHQQQQFFEASENNFSPRPTSVSLPPLLLDSNFSHHQRKNEDSERKGENKGEDGKSKDDYPWNIFDYHPNFPSAYVENGDPFLATSSGGCEDELMIPSIFPSSSPATALPFLSLSATSNSSLCKSVNLNHEADLPSLALLSSSPTSLGLPPRHSPLPSEKSKAICNSKTSNFGELGMTEREYDDIWEEIVTCNS